MLESSRREQLLADVRARLHRVCSDMPAERFEVMVQDIARVTLEYEGRATPTDYEKARLRRWDPVVPHGHAPAHVARS